MMSFNKDDHLIAIDTAMQELLTLQGRTKAPAKIQNQYIGTVIDNTVCLLTAPANSLDNGKRNATFSNHENWISVIQAVHRSFYSSVHLAIERGLDEYCNAKGIIVESSIKNQFICEYDKIKGGLPDVAEAQLAKLINKIVKGMKPNFHDYLQAAMDASQIEKTQKKMWRKFFDALTIIRNKASHSNPSLTESEVERLKDGGYGALVSKDNHLQINARNYFQIAFHTLDFFDELNA